MNKAIPIIVDTDPGVDDFFCIALALAYPELFDVKAICTIGGNHLTDVTTKNALDILKLLKRDDIPVARGADSYLYEAFGEPVEAFHGKNGIGNVELPHSDRQIDSLNAADKIYEVAKECNGELVIVTVGPETNLAIAMNIHPDLPKMIKRIVVMGGTTDKGNVSEYAEANIWHDASAAKIVFASGVPIDMIGLNVTRKAPLRKDILVGLNVRQDVANVIKKLIEFRNEEAMHDSIAISCLLKDDVFTWKDAYTYVIDDHSDHHGQTVLSDQLPYNSRVAIDIDVDAYYQLMKEMINRYQ